MKKILRFAKLPLYVSVLGCSPDNRDYSNELKKLNVDDQKLDNTDQSIEDRLKQLTQKSEQQEQVITSLQNLVRGKIDQSAMDAIVSKLPEGNIKDLISSLQTAQSTSVKQDDLTQLRVDLAAITSSQATTTSQQFEELRQDLEGQLRQKADASGLAEIKERLDILDDWKNKTGDIKKLEDGLSGEDLKVILSKTERLGQELNQAQGEPEIKTDLSQEQQETIGKIVKLQAQVQELSGELEELKRKILEMELGRQETKTILADILPKIKYIKQVLVQRFNSQAQGKSGANVRFYDDPSKESTTRKDVKCTRPKSATFGQLPKVGKEGKVRRHVSAGCTGVDEQFSSQEGNSQSSIDIMAMAQFGF